MSGTIALVAGATRGAGRGIAREYGFTDDDGSQPDWGRHFAEHVAGDQPTP